MNDYWTKAIVYARSAHVLLQIGDTDSAVSRGYFAMYDAARAVLETIDPKLAETKRHSTIIRRFSEHVVTGRPEHLRLSAILNSGEDTRLFADYTRRFVEPVKAKSVLSEMDEFLSAVAKMLSESYP